MGKRAAMKKAALLLKFFLLHERLTLWLMKPVQMGDFCKNQDKFRVILCQDKTNLAIIKVTGINFLKRLEELKKEL
jgi:hypothetical protein